MADITPKEALACLKNKNLQPAFSYKDVWHEEHAAAFTVAKATQLDVLADLHTAVVDAMEKGQSFESFRKNLKPVLQQKGWWGKKEMTDPLTRKTAAARLGSDRRLQTIYRVNMRSACQKGQYERMMASDFHPYLMYRIGPGVHHRNLPPESNHPVHGGRRQAPAPLPHRRFRPSFDRRPSVPLTARRKVFMTYRSRWCLRHTAQNA